MEKSVKKNDIWSIFMYLVVYSIAGFLIETTFGVVTKGVIESRKSFLYGPFCAIYGIGAIAMILFLKNEKNLWKLFFKGALIGATVEYLMSFVCEKFFGVKWWDYSGAILNIQGRTCLFYAVSWGVLAIILMKIINPNVDKLIQILKQKNNIFKIATACLMAFFCFDAILTGYAIKIFYYRVVAENKLNITNKNYAQEKYAEIEKNNDFLGFVNKYYDNEKMIKTYPNIMIEEENKNNIYVESLFDNYKVYYYSVGEVF